MPKQNESNEKQQNETERSNIEARDCSDNGPKDPDPESQRRSRKLADRTGSGVHLNDRHSGIS